LPIIFGDRGTPLYARARCSGEKVLVSAFLAFLRCRSLSYDLPARRRYRMAAVIIQQIVS
jgi:hypothetical protein